MEDFIVNRIEDIFDTVISIGEGSLVLYPETFNESIYNGIMTIMDKAVMPVAYIILALLCVLELYNVTIRLEGQHGTMGAEIPFRVMFKLAVCKIAVDSTSTILKGIYGVSTQLIKNIGTTLSGGEILTPADIEAIRLVVEDMDFGVKLITSVEVTIIYLIVQFISLIICVIVVGRMIELYVLMAIAPIPMSTIPNTELSNVAKNFLKAFSAVCLQGVLIYIVVSIFPMLFGSGTLGDISDATNFSKSLLRATGYSLILLISIFSTSKWAKSICNAM